MDGNASGNAIRLLERSRTIRFGIFASIHFNTDQIWERHRFTALNKNTKKSRQSCICATCAIKSLVLTLFGLSNNTKDFALYNRVCWASPCSAAT